ncbi:MAG: alpha/beta hydrolase [Rhodoglobus sp.]
MGRALERRPWIRRRSSKIGITALALGIIAALVWTLSPWTATLLIRALFDRDAKSTLEEMEKHATDVPLTESLGEEYGEAGASTSLDVFSPAGSSGPLTTVVWTHGGAWISGDKSNVTPYVRNLAAEGFAVVVVNYTVSPEAIYPVALYELNDALEYLLDNAERLRIDPHNISFAGDSAGAQLSAQLAAATTNANYASTVGVSPSLSADQLQGVILNCGIYDVTADFPRTWISGGNADPLTALQSRVFADTLTELGVETSTVFYPEDHAAQLPHEYQFHLDLDDARLAFDSTVQFLKTLDE